MLGLAGRGGPVRTVERFLAARAAKDVFAAAQLMAEDVRFIDSAGEVIAGRANVIESFRRFARLAPDYRIEVSDISSRGNEVLIRGRSVCADARLTGETLWRAAADGRHLREWQGYSPDGTPQLTRILMPELMGEGAAARIG